jgi:hypothetical protein
MTMGFMLLAPISIYVVETINDSYMEIPSTPGQTPATPVTRREATNYSIGLQIFYPSNLKIRIPLFVSYSYIFTYIIDFIFKPFLLLFVLLYPLH